jgi:DNA-binding MarR family transcriptional regulator
LHAQRAARALARRFDDGFRPFNLTNQQFALLMALSRREAPTIGPVARALEIDRTTLTAALKVLERRMLLTVEVDTADRRTRRLRLTQAGQAALSEALPVWHRIHAEIAAEKPDLDLNALRASLRALA